MMKILPPPRVIEPAPARVVHQSAEAEVQPVPAQELGGVPIGQVFLRLIVIGAGIALGGLLALVIGLSTGWLEIGC